MSLQDAGAAPSVDAGAQGLRGAWSMVRAPGAAAPRVGDELRFEARLRLPDGARPVYAAWPEDPLAPWVPLGEPSLVVARIDGPEDEWTATFGAMPLKGGLLESPPVALELGGGALPLAAARVEVEGVLAEGEDAPRTLFQPPQRFDASASSAGLPLVVWGWLALPPLVAACFWWRRRSSRTALAGAEQSPLERVAALEARWKHDRSEGRESLHGLCALVRAAHDARAGVARAAMGGMDWADAVEAEGAADAAAFVRRIEPLRWCCDAVPPELVQARFDEARRILAARSTEAPRR